jgi:DNA-binding NarL/FixJ family response regulator
MLIPESTVDWWINLHSCNSGEREAPPPKDSCRAGGVVNSLTSWSISENKLKERNSDSQEGVAVKRKNNKKDLRKLLNAAQGLEVESKAEDDSKPLWRLTRREREVYPLLAKQNKEISSALNITESTVKFHVGNITRKLGRSRHEILAKNWLERQ